MDSFRTALDIKPASHDIKLQDPILTVGSCFADNLGQLLERNKFQVMINPFGTQYNPVSIHKVLGYAIQSRQPLPPTYGELNGTQFNYDFHSSFSTLQKDLLEKNIQKTLATSHTFIASAKVIVITYGTAWVYERKDRTEVVSNCHKMPATLFTKTLLTQKKILASFNGLYQLLKAINPSLKIILTLSPVRHLKDTLELNAVSKSVLRLACHTISTTYPQVDYFPAYEIVMDDLRDYRFYDEDLLHPSPQAISYIWKLFGSRYFSEDTKKFIQRWGAIQKALDHRPFLPTSSAHQQFLKGVLAQLEELKTIVNVDKEWNEVQRLILP